MSTKPLLNPRGIKPLTRKRLKIIKMSEHTCTKTLLFPEELHMQIFHAILSTV